jgi:transportin-1
VYKQAHHLIHTVLIQDRNYNQGATAEPPDKEFLVAALDLMSGLVQGLGEHLGPLISQTTPNLIELVTHCLRVLPPRILIQQDEIDDVRQSGFALLGDLAISCFPFLQPYLPEIMHTLIPQIVPEGTAPSVCNNAAWAAGEIAIQIGPQFRPFVLPLLERLIQVMNASSTPGPVAENSAIAAGRLGLVCPDEVAPQLSAFAAAFIRALKDVRDNDEKDSAFRGFCTLIGKNPSGLSGDLTNFVIAVAKYAEPSQELGEMFQTVYSPFAWSDLDSPWLQECD